jgi:hypothetical protein
MNEVNFFNLSRNDDMGAHSTGLQPSRAREFQDRQGLGNVGEALQRDGEAEKLPLAMIFNLQADCGDDTICLQTGPLFKFLHFWMRADTQHTFKNLSKIISRLFERKSGG